MAQPIARTYKIEVDASKAVRELKKISGSTKNIADRFDVMQRAAYKAFAAFGAVQALSVLTKAADQIKLLEGSFEALTGSAERAADMTQRVFDTVQETGAGLEDTASTFQRLTIGFQELGGTNEQIEAVANTFIKLGRVSGTSIVDTNAALVQFSQGLASGKLQGDELRSIMERLPLITGLIADEFSRVNGGIKVTRGEVKQLGREGKITSEIMGNALLRASEEVATQFAGLVFTMEQELNAFLGTAQEALADFAEASGIGDVLKGSIGGANQALKDFRRNISQFTKDMTYLFETFGAFQLAVAGLAFAFAWKLVPAIGLVSKALFLLVVNNPFTAFAALAITAVTLIIAKWDKLKAFFLYQVPSWWFQMLVAWEDVMGAMSTVATDTWKDIKQFFLDGVNAVLDIYNDFSEALYYFTDAKVDVGWFDTIEMEKAGAAVDENTEKLSENAKKVVEYREKYLDAIRTMNGGDDGDGDVGLFDGVGTDSTKLKGFLSEFDKLLEKVKKLEDPLAKVNEQLATARYLVGIGQLTETQFQLLEDDLTGVTKAAAAAAKEWAAYVDATHRALDPTIALNEELVKIERLWAESEVNFVEYMRLRAEATGDMGVALEETSEKMTGLTADLSQAGNHFIEGFSTGFADALLDGSSSFSDFAESILEDLARMILRAIIFSSITSGLAGTSVGNFLGIPAKTTGVNTASGPSVLAGTSDPTNTVGVLRPPTYGAGAPSSSDGNVTVNVHNNAQAEVQTQTRETSQGLQIDILVKDLVNKALNTGGLDQSLQTNFGLSRRAF